jgi:hypothetical protein
MTMATLKWLVFAIVVAALLPAGRDILDELARGLAAAKPTLRGDDKAKTNPRRAELETSIALLRGNRR